MQYVLRAGLARTEALGTGFGWHRVAVDRLIVGRPQCPGLRRPVHPYVWPSLMEPFCAGPSLMETFCGPGPRPPARR